MENKLNMRKLLVKQRGFCCSAALKTQEKGKNINVCQGKSTTVLARKRNICKLRSWYWNNGEEN